MEINLENIRKQIKGTKEFKKFTEEKFTSINCSFCKRTKFGFIYNEIYCVIIIDLDLLWFKIKDHFYKINETNLFNQIKYIVKAYLE